MMLSFVIEPIVAAREQKQPTVFESARVRSEILKNMLPASSLVSSETGVDTLTSKNYYFEISEFEYKRGI